MTPACPGMKAGLCADSGHAEQEALQERPHKKQRMMGAFRMLLPGQERRDKCEHCV